MTDKSLAEAIRDRVAQIRGESPYSYQRRGRVMPWGENHAVEAAMLEIADVIDEFFQEGKYHERDSDSDHS